MTHGWNGYWPSVNRLTTDMDATLQLLDRQVIDCEGLMVCKVDDLELSIHPGGEWTVTGLLAGPSVLLPRFSGHLGAALRRHWTWLGVEQREHDRPWRIDFSLVDRLDSAVHLHVARKDVLRKQEPATSDVDLRRLNDLLELKVVSDGIELGHVLDVRVSPVDGDLRCVSLVVGRGRPGTMLGYDRNQDMGPAVLRRAIRWMHRHTGLVDLSEVRHVDWDEGCIDVSSHLRELTGA